MFVFIKEGSITSVRGIKAAGIHAGLKRKRKDLALIVSDKSCSVAGTFTQNKVKAAPLIVSEKTINSKGKIRAVLINSGNANAATGEKGYNDALEMQRYCAEKLNIKQDEVLISSTGVIGEYLPMDIIKNGIDSIVGKLTKDAGTRAAEAIMTTDTVPKSFAVEVKLSCGKIIIGGIAKGSGMIMPNMATMLAFIATDAELENSLLKSLLLKSVNNSFNKISVDGDTSTNDMVTLMANGLSGCKIKRGSEDEKIFFEALQALTIEMAKAIVKDGEGATKLIEVNVCGCKTQNDADLVAKTIANSLLVKTAIYGNDANWGRILAAIGRSGADFVADEIKIKFNDMIIFENGYKSLFDENKASEILSNDEVAISIDLNSGNCKTTWWTCDITEKYVEINSAYRT